MRIAFQSVALIWLLSGTAAAQEVLSGNGAVLRGLDKVSSVTRDIEVRRGETVSYGRLRITLSDCRYPEGTPARATAYLVIEDVRVTDPAFAGWMLSSAPALNALDHPRYDVWVLRCSTS